MNLLKGNIRKQLLAIAIPATLGSLFSTLYNLTDTFFASQASEVALSGVSATFPLFILLLAASAGVSVGIQVYVGKNIGAKDYHEARMYARTGLYMTIVFSIVASLLGLLFSQPILQFMGLSGEALHIAQLYLTIIYLGSLSFSIPTVFSSVLAALGNTKPQRNILIFGFFLNIALDPLFMFTFNMGVVGIAIATVISQTIQIFYLGYFLLKSDLFAGKTFVLKTFAWKRVNEILKQAIPASLNMILFTVGIFVLNRYVVAIAGNAGMAGYNVGYRFEQMILIPSFGVSTAMMSMLSQHIGAKKVQRSKEIVKTATIMMTMIMTFGMLLILIVGPYFTKAFNLSPDATTASNSYMYFEMLILIGYGLMSIGTTMLQATSHPNIPLAIGIFRQALAPIFLYPIYIGFLGFQLTSLWTSIVFTNWIAALFLYLIGLYYLNRLLKTFPNE